MALIKVMLQFAHFVVGALVELSEKRGRWVCGGVMDLSGRVKLSEI